MFVRAGATREWHSRYIGIVVIFYNYTCVKVAAFQDIWLNVCISTLLLHVCDLALSLTLVNLIHSGLVQK
jgi:hypothetical protein